MDGLPLTRQFVALRAHLNADGGMAASEELWLLLERSAPEQDLKQYVVSGPATMSLDELAQIAHRRPVIERNSYENAKQEVGLDNYQGRSWIGFHHHLAMVRLALTWLILQSRPVPPPDLPPQGNTPAPHHCSTRHPLASRPSLRPCLCLNGDPCR